MKKGLALLIMALLVLAGCSPTGRDAEDTLHIGVLVFAEHPALEAAVEGMQAYLADNGLDETKVTYTVQNAQADSAIADTIARNFVNDGVDLIYAVATNSAQAAYNATLNTDIPVVFNAVTDPVAAEIVASLDHPGGNVTGVSDEAPIEKQLQLIKEILPEATKIGMLQNSSEVNSQVQIELVQELAPKYGLEVVVKSVSAASEIAIAAGQLAEAVDAIYTITDNLIVNATATIVHQATLAAIPVFNAEDGQKDQGILASDSISYLELGKVAGKQIVSILVDGQDPGAIAVEKSTATNLFLNQTKAAELNIELPQSVVDRASKEQ